MKSRLGSVPISWRRRARPSAPWWICSRASAACRRSTLICCAASAGILGSVKSSMCQTGPYRSIFRALCSIETRRAAAEWDREIALAIDFLDHRLAGNPHANQPPAQPNRQHAGDEEQRDPNQRGMAGRVEPTPAADQPNHGGEKCQSHRNPQRTQRSPGGVREENPNREQDESNDCLDGLYVRKIPGDPTDK